MVSAVIEASYDKSAIEMRPDIFGAMMELRAFLTANVYTNSLAKAEEEKAKELLISLYEYYFAHPEEMPPLYIRIMESEGVGRAVCDFVSGMTDRYAVDLYRKLFVPAVWKGGSL